MNDEFFKSDFENFGKFSGFSSSKFPSSSNFGSGFSNIGSNTPHIESNPSGNGRKKKVQKVTKSETRTKIINGTKITIKKTISYNSKGEEIITEEKTEEVMGENNAKSITKNN